jgi:hypothetical protein
VGIRFLMENNISTPDQSGDLVPFEVDPVNIFRTETNWTIAQRWSAKFSGSSSIDTGDWLNDQVAATLFGTVFPRCSNKVQLHTIKASPIASDGSVVGGMTTLLTWTSSFTGGSESGNPLPFENSVVASWNTPVIGPKGRGRIYWPVMSASQLNSDGRLDSTTQAGFLADVVSMLEGFVITGGVGHSEWALPIVTGGDYTKYGVITGVRVGDVIDTQRRRRRQLVETYVSASPSY